MGASTKYDDMYRRLAANYGVPVEYMRTLAHWESSQNPQNKTGGQWGLFQLSADQVDDYNKREGTKLTHADMLKPEENTRVWLDWYGRFADLARKTGIPNLKPDWDNPEWVLLVTAAHNGGAWTKAGVLKIAKWLRDSGEDVTHDNLFLFGGRAGGAWTFKGNPLRDGLTTAKKALDKRKWQRSVGSQYWVARRLGMNVTLPDEKKIKAAETKAKAKAKGGSALWLLLLFLLLGKRSRD